MVATDVDFGHNSGAKAESLNVTGNYLLTFITGVHMKGTRLENPSRRFSVQNVDFIGGEGGTRTLDLGIMSAEL